MVELTPAHGAVVGVVAAAALIHVSEGSAGGGRMFCGSWTRLGNDGCGRVLETGWLGLSA